MYNITTEQKIKDIPSIGDIELDRLPQELTRIYAQIVSLRRKVADGTFNFQDSELHSGLKLLRDLANNLETILLTHPNHQQKESIAFVAATANSLIFKMGLKNSNDSHLELNSISPYVASVILFLISNSQADASEVSNMLSHENEFNLIRQELISSITTLATGQRKNNKKIEREKITIDEDFQEVALNLLWRELYYGIDKITSKLAGIQNEGDQKHFDKVIELSIYQGKLFDQRSVFAGPYRLAKLLKILEADIFKRAVISIPVPQGVDPTPWNIFLKNLASERPYLWENHREAVDKGFLEIGMSTVLTLPTGAGKSTLSELKIASCIYSGKRAIYLVPTHALEDQINKNFKKIFSDFESLHFESDSEYTEVGQENILPILVMTPEKCLTLLNTNEDLFKTVGVVVFDEFHLIHGVDIKKDRRSIDAMFCLLSLFTLIPKADYLLISAMVENGDEIKDWVSQLTQRQCLSFNSTWKPTRQLHGCLVFEEDKILQLTRQVRSEKLLGKTKGPSTKLKNSLLASPECIFSMKNIWETTNDQDYFRTSILDKEVKLGVGTSNSSWYLTSNRNEVAANLAIHFAKLGLKTLVFVDTPIVANSTAKTISDGLTDYSEVYSQFLIQNKRLIHTLTLELSGFEHSYLHAFKNVGVHHGLLLPIERNLIEQYFKSSNGATVLIATATLAQGINLPAEIVIIAGDDRFDESESNREKVKPHELLNAAGRAGRAGLSAQGAVILIPGEIVTVKELTISDKWWELKQDVFSKGDQCLKIEDPLGYYLDSLTSNAGKLDKEQISILYRFKSEKLPVKDTEKLINNSFYAFKTVKNGKQDLLATQVNLLLDKRNALDNETEDIDWTKEVSYKSGVDPSIILELSKSIDNENFETFCSKSILEFIDWFFVWLATDDSYIQRIFTKPNVFNQIKKSIGLKYEVEYSNQVILEKIGLLSSTLKQFVSGKPLKEINKLIPDSGKPDNSIHLKKARNFVLRLIPELSFGFGLLTMVLIEKTKQKGINKNELPLNVRVLASCIREGFDDSEMLNFKRKNKLFLRVETHELYYKLKSGDK